MTDVPHKTRRSLAEPLSPSGRGGSLAFSHHRSRHRSQLDDQTSQLEQPHLNSLTRHLVGDEQHTALVLDPQAHRIPAFHTLTPFRVLTTRSASSSPASDEARSTLPARA